MATIDTLNNIIVLHIVYDGTTASGKTACLHALRTILNKDIEIFSPEQSDTGETLYFDWMEYQGGYFKGGYNILCQIITVPGLATLQARRRFLLELADVVIFVADASNLTDEMVEYFQELQQVTPLDSEPFKTVVQANKHDLSDALPTEEWQELLADYPDIRIIDTSAVTGAGIRESFVMAVSLAIKRADYLMSKGRLRFGASDIPSKEALLENLNNHVKIAPASISSAKIEELAEETVLIQEADEIVEPLLETETAELEELAEETVLIQEIDEIAEPVLETAESEELTEEAVLIQEADEIAEPILETAEFEELAEEAVLIQEIDEIAEPVLEAVEFEELTEETILIQEADEIAEPLLEDAELEELAEETVLIQESDEIAEPVLEAVEFEELAEETVLIQEADEITEPVLEDVESEELLDEAVLIQEADEIAEPVLEAVEFEELAEEAVLIQEVDEIAEPVLEDAELEELAEETGLIQEAGQITKTVLKLAESQELADKSILIQEDEHPTIATLDHKHLPILPDENPPLQWISPPLSGRKILQDMFNYALKPHLLPHEIWAITAADQWCCISKEHWQYIDENQAVAALRDFTALQLHYSPLLPRQRCLVLSQQDQNWRLWQITHQMPNLNELLAEALLEQEVEKMVLETFRCASRYIEVCRKAAEYAPHLNICLDTIGVDTGAHLVYLGNLEEQNDNSICLDQNGAKDVIKQHFSNPIYQALQQTQIDIMSVLDEFDKIQPFDVDIMVVQALTEIFEEAA